MGIRQTAAKVSTGGSGAATLTVVFPGATLAGNGVVVMVSAWYSGTIDVTSIVATHDTMTLAAKQANALNSNSGGFVYYKSNITGGDTDFVITFVGNPTYAEAVAIEVDNMTVTTPYDTAASGVVAHVAAGTSATVTGGSNPAQANNIVCAVLSYNNATSNGHITTPASSGYTSLGVNQDPNTTIGAEFSYKFISATGALQSAAWTFDSTSGGDSAVLAVFKTTSSSNNTTITPTTGTLGVTGLQPAITAPVVITPGAGALAFTGRQVSVATSGNVTITPTTGALTFTGRQAAPLAGGANTTITPTTGALAITELTPSQTLGVPTMLAGGIVLTGYQPGVSQGAVRSAVTGALALTGLQPTVTQAFFITPGAGALGLTGQSANVQANGNTTITPSAGALGVTGLQATLSQVNPNPTLQPLAAALAFTGYQPTLKIEVVTPVTITPGTGSLSFSGKSPTRTVSLPTGFYPTVFVDDVTPVPSSASYIGGAAFAQTGERYVCYWPANNHVVFLGGLAHRWDGAMVIDPNGAIVGKIQGLGLTFRGELVTTLSPRELDHNGFPLRQTGHVCVTNQS